MRLVIIESPYAARAGTKPWWRWWDRWENMKYARRCMRDSLMRQEAPLASHILYTPRGILNDNYATERLMGMKAGWGWMRRADLVAVYCDRGISPGMTQGILRARDLGIPVEQRRIDHDDQD